MAPTHCTHGKPLPKMTDRHAKSGGQGNGMNWLRPEKRLACYLRDGLACAYCGAAVEEGTKLTLDHITPHSQGGCNCAQNLVTCCFKCNSSRGNRSVEAFAAAAATYLNHGVTASMILAHITDCIARPLDVASAKAMMAKRGGFSAALRGE
jgi:hypothetical protein